jgi:hypothetical protein
MFYKGRELESFSGRQSEQFKDHSGKQIGDWYVICRAPNNKKMNSRFWCECKCGYITMVVSYSLVNSKGSRKCKRCVSKLPRKKRESKYFKDIPFRYWISVVNSAKKRSLVFNITIEQAYDLYLKQNKRCKLTDLEIRFDTSKLKNHYFNSASLDRIDSSRGYTLDNIQWVHKDVNKMKSNLSSERFFELCALVTKNNQE